MLLYYIIISRHEVLYDYFKSNSISQKILAYMTNLFYQDVTKWP